MHQLLLRNEENEEVVLNETYEYTRQICYLNAVIQAKINAQQTMKYRSLD